MIFFIKTNYKYPVKIANSKKYSFNMLACLQKKDSVTFSGHADINVVYE